MTATAVIAGFVIMLVLIFMGMHVATALFLTGLLGGVIYLGIPTISQFGIVTWGVQNSFILTAVPLYILLGEILLRSGVTERMYASLSDWTGQLPGGLLHTNIIACSLFSAVSGSSVAAAATIGTVALPAFQRRRYSERLVLGSITAGGTLGILIPPSIAMIIYGAITDTSIGTLFVAGVVPGVLLALLFMVTIVTACLINPSWGDTDSRQIQTPLRDRLRRLIDMIPILVIVVVVLGGIYLGWATPTESASLGVLAALAIAASYRKLTLKLLYDSFAAMLRTTGMLMLIIVGAFFLNFVISILGIPQTMASYVSSLGVSPELTIWSVVVFYLVLGCFMETMSMMIATVPIIVPVLVQLGFDPVWFGIVVVILMEAALITPPVGMNLYVVQSVRGGGPIRDVIFGTIPFVIPMIVLLALIIFFPGIAMWLPETMRK